jgi:thioredoxin 1
MEDIATALENHADKLVVIDFTSKNCQPCKKVAPLYEELSESEEFSEKVVFLKVDVDENQDAVSKYQVTGWPTFIFIKKGEVQSEIVGGKLAEATLYDWVKLLMPKE